MKRFLLILALCSACFGQAANQLITLSANGRYLVNSTTAANTPVYLTGDAPQLLPTMLCSADMLQYLNDRQQRGINVAWVILVDNVFSAHPPTNCNTDTPFNGADFTNFNTNYWNYIDTIVSAASARGITLLMNVAFVGLNGSQGYFNDFNGSVSGATWTAYGTFLGNRYKTANNIIWLLGGDFDPSNATIKTNIGLLGTAIAAADPNHIATVETCRFCTPANQSSYDSYAGSPPSWVKLNWTYNTQPTVVSGCQASYTHLATIPPLMGEDWYELENSMTAFQVRQEGYWETLSGCYLGRIFGNGQIWPFSSPNSGNGTTPNWKTQLASSGSQGEEYLGQLMRTRHHWLMVPDTTNTYLTGGIGSGATLAVLARSSDGQTMIAYKPNGNASAMTINMAGITSTSSLVNSWWYNPQTGIAAFINTFANSGSHNFTAPDANDWVLVLDDAAANMGTPGTTAGLGIIAPSRSIDWTKAGLSLAFGDGETTVNPWTPPVRTQCVNTQCATVTSAAGSSTPAQINAAVANAPQATYVLLPPGPYNINANLSMQANNVTLRGSGPMSTILNFSGASTSINYSVCCNSAQHGALNLTAYPMGTSTVTIASATCGAVCPNLVPGNIGFIIECDEGFTGTPPYGGFASTCAGAYVDGYPAGSTPIMTAGRDVGNFNQNNAINGTHAYRQQNVIITNVTPNGGGSYTINFTPGLYLADWSSNRNAMMWWSNVSDDSFGMGLEDMTIHMVAGGSNKIGFGGTCNSWVKGVRLIVGSVNTAFPTSRGCHNLIANNYIVASDPAALISNISEALTFGDATTSGGLSDTLDLNNIVTDTLCHWGEGNSEGNCSAYNHCRNAQQPDYQPVDLDHFAGRIFQCNEGDYLGRMQSDNTHGNEALNTNLRNYVNGDDPPFYTQNPGATQYPAYNRFLNAIGNALGGNRSAIYQNTSNSQGAIWTINNNNTNTGVPDPIPSMGLFRWGNCDVITAGCKFDNTEVPSALTNNAAGYLNPLPGSTNLPCSLFIAAYANNVSSPCVPKLTGGTGLSWWKNCIAWSSFPTSCTTTQIQPFPPVGPELSGGPFVNGHAYDNPAGIAFKNLPTDKAFQHAFNVTASSTGTGIQCSIAGAGSASAPYSPCTVLIVTLTAIGGNISAEHIMGGFQLANPGPGCDLSSGISWTNRADNEKLITSSSTTAIVYANSGSPALNACASTSIGTGTSVTMSGATATFSGTFTTTGLVATSVVGVTGCTGVTTYNDIPWTIVTVNATTITATASNVNATGLGAGSACTLFANPLLYPDVRQFDESIYQADTAGPVIPPPPALAPLFAKGQFGIYGQGSAK